MTFEQVYTAIVKDCCAVRGISVSKDEALTYLRLLKGDNYTIEQLQAAKLWILKGDWTFKKQNRLELSDFYPTENQMKMFRDETVTLTKIDFHRKMKANYERGLNDGRAEATEYYEKKIKEIKNEL